jgi:L-arabinose isomerase
MQNTKPKIGLLGLMTDGYEPIFPGITARQEKYARELAEQLSPAAEIVFPGAGLNRESIEKHVRLFNASERSADSGFDGILIVLLTYSHAVYLLRALQDNRLPIALAVVQPNHEVLDDWEELDLTVNQGLHGAQDNANMIGRLGVKCQFFAGDRREKRFLDFVRDFAKAAQTYRRMGRLKTAVIGRMTGMGDIMSDDMAFLRKTGIEMQYDSIGTILQLMKDIDPAQVDAQMEKDRQTFLIDPKLSRDSHAEAVRMYLAFRRFLTEKGYGAFTAHFDVFGQDGRFRQLPLYAASQLMADGFGYAAEGDYICASMVAAAHSIADRFNDGNFTEMYTMDFVKNAIIFCHAGEGNWATGRQDIKPRLIDRYLGEGGLENPPTIMFTPEAGPSTLTSLASLAGNRFRLVLAKGEILPKNDLKKCEMPYFFWRPETGISKCVEGWLKQGGTHHEVINIGDVSARWKMLCDMWDAEYVEV